MIVYGFYEFDGRVQRAATALKEKGYKVDVISLKWKNEENFSVYDGIKVHKILTRNFREIRAADYLLQSILFFSLATFITSYLYIREKYDLIYVNNIPDFLVFVTVLPKIFGSKIILDIHDLVPEFAIQKFYLSENHVAVKILKAIERISCLYAHRVITVTDLWKRRLISRGIPENKCTVITNEPNLKLFYTQNIICKDNKKFILVYHGNLSEQNGLDVLIKSINIIRDSIPSLQLFIIGETRKNNNFIELIKKLELSEHVIIHSSIPHSEIPKLLLKADIGIDPKKDGVYSGETLSVKVMEYMALGIPAIVSRTKASNSYFNDSIVEFFESENEVDLANKILKLYNDSKRRQELVIAANKYIKEHNWDNNKPKFYSLLNDLFQG